MNPDSDPELKKLVEMEACERLSSLSGRPFDVCNCRCRLIPVEKPVGCETAARLMRQQQQGRY